MITTVENTNFGWSTAVDGYWAAVGNPNPFRYDPLSSSIIRTGSVEVYRYNINTDTHDKKTTLYRPLTVSESVVLSTESASYAPIGPYYYIHTELTGTVPMTADMDLLVDTGIYYTASGDAYGWALDLRNTILAVGNPYSISKFTFGTASFYFSSSGYVDLFDLSTLDIDPYAYRTNPTITSTGSISGFVSFNVYVPPGQNYSYVLLQSLDTTDPLADWINVNILRVSNDGGNVTITTTYTSITNLDFRAVGIIGTDPYITTVWNPNPVVSESFGRSVSINDEWLAVGSPLESGSAGSVFMFRKINGNNLSWSLYQTLPLPPDISTGDQFGYSVGLNKCSGSYSGSMVVGSLKLSHSRAYIYEFSNSVWSHTFTLYPDNTTIYPLTFNPTLPVTSSTYPNYADLFGYDVAMFRDTVIVGAPKDRSIYEYPGSSLYYQGAVYLFERCNDPRKGYYLARKSYGNEKIIKNNWLGWSVGVYDQYAVAGAPKINSLSMSICYLRGSLFQEHFCDDNSENKVDGQFVLFNKTTGSIPDTTNVDWEITNIYQIKKRLLEPYRCYGWNVDISNQFISVGAPMLVSGSRVTMDLNSITGSYTGSLEDIGDLSGKAYIYNLKNLREKFYVGNVFYRNGKLVIMTSGSAFEGVQIPTMTDSYEYTLNFKSKHVIFEKQVVCSVEPGEFNVSTNPTAIVLPMADFDINANGRFDFQDVDILLRYMKYKSTEASGRPITNWSASIINTATDEEQTVYDMYYSQWDESQTSNLFTASYNSINTSLFTSLDFNEDNKIDNNDMNILWKYFICRLTQKNYETYITPNSQKKYLSDIIDFLNSKTLKGRAATIRSDFLDFTSNTKSDPTGSYLAPYVTTIGLFEGCDLVAVAKLGSPIKITPDFPINFVVKIDF